MTIKESLLYTLDKYSILPKLSFIFYSYLLYEVSFWFMGLPNPSTIQQVFAGVVWGTQTASLGLYLNFLKKKQDNSSGE